MPIPDYQTLMRPLLEVLADDAEHPLRDIKDKVALHFDLTPDEREQPNGHSTAPPLRTFVRTVTALSISFD